MKCYFCNHEETKVLDSRTADESSSIRRRRECLKCTKRFTTYETVETTPILIVKIDKTREPFDINKVKNAVIKACAKRPVPLKQIDELADKIAIKVQNAAEKEMLSSTIGEWVMEELKLIDAVAYVRFASVYRQFADISTFADFIKNEAKNARKR